MVWLILCFFIVFLLNLFMLFIQEEKILKSLFFSSIECGFSSLVMSKEFFNQFFMISSIFVIFDMELVIVFPLPVISYEFSFYLIISVVIYLLMSLMLEILNGLIYWSK